MFQPRPAFVLDQAYRRGYRTGLAAYDPSRIVTVNVSRSFSAALDDLQVPRLISLRTRQDTPIRDMVMEIHTKLPTMEDAITITTSGSHPRELTQEDDSTVMSLLPKFDAITLLLRLNIQSQSPDVEPPNSWGSRVRKALLGRRGLSKGSKDEPTTITPVPKQAASPQPTLWAAPPRYEESAIST